MIETLKEAKDFPRSEFVISREDVLELFSYVSHDSWRCNYYGKCHCGLDEITEKLGLEKVPCTTGK